MTPISVQKLGAMEPTNGLCREEVDKTQISGRISARICPQAETILPSTTNSTNSSETNIWQGFGRKTRAKTNSRIDNCYIDVQELEQIIDGFLQTHVSNTAAPPPTPILGLQHSTRWRSQEYLLNRCACNFTNSCFTRRRRTGLFTCLLQRLLLLVRKHLRL